jgi:cellulose synthase (UDP-forming)
VTNIERRNVPAAPPLPSTRNPFWGRHFRLVQLLAVAALCWGGAYLVWRVWWSGRGTPVVLFVLLLAAEVFGWVSLGLYAFLAWRVPSSERPGLPSVLPSIDVFVCIYDEPLEVLEATLAGCRAIRVPHVTFVLDDGRRPQVRALAARMGARYVTRPDNRHAKAGNINHALGVTEGELILFLDADHVPLPEILDATVGYFVDPAVALVQTPHDFSNRDSVQHTRAERHEQTLFYDVIAPGKDRHNAMFWCGSATLVRRAALDDVGGVLTDTVAEDFHTTIAMHARGWRTHYHNEVLVQGLAPHDLGAFLLQRARWARGNLGVFRTKENPLTCRGLTPAQRTCYFASLFNYFSAAQRLLLLLVLSWTLATGELPMHASFTTLAGLWLPWSLLAFVATSALARGALGPFDSTRYGILTIGVNLRGMAAMFSPRAGTFRVTPKEGVDEGGLRVVRMVGLVSVLAVVLAAVWVLRILAWAGAVSLPTMAEFATVITVVLGAWELGCIAATIASLVRRRQVRRHYRAPVALRARVASTPTVVQLLDLTTAGVGMLSPFAVERGTTFELLTRLPDARGAIHDVTLTIEGRSCVEQPAGGYRVGGALDVRDAATRSVLIEFCYVVLPQQRLAGPTELPELPAKVRLRTARAS